MYNVESKLLSSAPDSLEELPDPEASDKRRLQLTTAPGGETACGRSTARNRDQGLSTPANPTRRAHIPEAEARLV